MYGLTRIKAGFYRHRSGRLIVRTEWEDAGPNGGTAWLWESMTEHPHGNFIDNDVSAGTLREAAQRLDELARGGSNG